MICLLLGMKFGHLNWLSLYMFPYRWHKMASIKKKPEKLLKLNCTDEIISYGHKLQVCFNLLPRRFYIWGFYSKGMCHFEFNQKHSVIKVMHIYVYMPNSAHNTIGQGYYFTIYMNFQQTEQSKNKGFISSSWLAGMLVLTAYIATRS